MVIAGAEIVLESEGVVVEGWVGEIEGADGGVVAVAGFEEGEDVVCMHVQISQ